MIQTILDETPPIVLSGLSPASGVFEPAQWLISIGAFDPERSQNALKRVGLDPYAH